MSNEIKVAMIGLDTSHTEAFVRRMPGTGLRATRCLAFETPFQDAKGIAERTKTMKELGVEVTTEFDRAVGDCDAVMIELNDPALHLEYFRRCAALGKPVFLDKPLADSLASGREIAATAEKHGTKWFSCSPLRCETTLLDAIEKVGTPREATMWGVLGQAPTGSSLIWYGVHVFEMIERALGPGAQTVQVAVENDATRATVTYEDGRRARAEFPSKSYGGVLRNAGGTEVRFDVPPGSAFYDELVKQVAEFFRTGTPPVGSSDAIEVMGMLDAAERSFQSGREEPVSV